jgi:thioredoxin 1
MSENITIVTDNSFATEVLQANIPVMVDFWADWCGPCKMLAPTLEEIAKEFIGRVKVAKVNVDENSKTSTSYDIHGIPTLILFKNGKIVATKVGVATKTQIADFINTNLAL